MTKTQKKIFGCFGLGLVAAMTVVAASMPIPIASATTVTDTIQIRVVNGTPTIEVSADVEQGEVTTSPLVDINVTFDSVDNLSIDLDYTGPDGVLQHFDDIRNISPDDISGQLLIPIVSNHGYGHYVYTVTATGFGDGAPAEEVVEFDYAPFTATAEQDKTDDGKTIDVVVGPFADDVDEVQIWINGVLVDTVDEPGTYKFKPEDLGGSIYDDGTYDVVLKALHNQTDGEGNPILDEHGNPVQDVIYVSPEMVVNFQALPNPDTGAPDTGGLFKNLNVSKEDYLVTGVIVFLVIGVVAFGIVARNRKSSSKSRKR